MTKGELYVAHKNAPQWEASFLQQALHEGLSIYIKLYEFFKLRC
jgi:hypothetical protein